MMSLYLQENLIRNIEGLDAMQNLMSLNLSDNMIHKVENLGVLPKLQTLQLKRNRIGKGGLGDVINCTELLECSVLDLSDNYIEDPEILPQVL